MEKLGLTQKWKINYSRKLMQNILHRSAQKARILLICWDNYIKKHDKWLKKTI